jgi:hypothetical protein
VTRPTKDESILSQAAQDLMDWEGKGCPEHHARGNRVTDRHPVVDATADTDEIDPLTERTCVAAYCLNEHDAPGDMAHIDSPVASYGGGYAACSVWMRNTLALALACIAIGLLFGVFYLLTHDWSDFLAGIRELSSW